MDLNHWDIGMDLATKYNQSKHVESTMVKYTTYLQESGNPLHAVQVLIKGGQQLEAAKILVQLAHQMATIKVAYLLLISMSFNTNVESIYFDEGCLVMHFQTSILR
jgi:hypothetical protein